MRAAGMTSQSCRESPRLCPKSWDLIFCGGPLTHDLLANILRALEAKVDRVIVNDLKHGTYFARLVLSAENELNQKKIIEIDARPSDCIAMAIQQSAPIYVNAD